MKLKRNSIMRKIKNNINDFFVEHEEINLAIGKLKSFFPSQNERYKNYNENIAITHINAYSSFDYIAILKLIDCGYNLIINYSYVEEQYKNEFIFNLRKGLMERGMYMSVVSSSVIMCAQSYVDVIDTRKAKKSPTKIYRFPTRSKSK